MNENNTQMKVLNEENLRLERELKMKKKELDHSQKILKKFIAFYKKQEKSIDFSVKKLLEENTVLKAIFLFSLLFIKVLGTIIREFLLYI